eukprot:m.35964 g.35964  ORF g.35964 m.35964 type:complete len:90 (-) comp10063_c0_seq3:40-309(-)
MGGRRDQKNNQNNPGPGQYTAPSGLSNIGATIKGRTKEKNMSDSPGPGNYNASLTPGKRSAPAFSMGTRTQQKQSEWLFVCVRSCDACA